MFLNVVIEFDNCYDWVNCTDHCSDDVKLPYIITCLGSCAVQYYHAIYHAYGRHYNIQCYTD